MFSPEEDDDHVQVGTSETVATVTATEKDDIYTDVDETRSDDGDDDSDTMSMTSDVDVAQTCPDNEVSHLASCTLDGHDVHLQEASCMGSYLQSSSKVAKPGPAGTVW